MPLLAPRARTVPRRLGRHLLGSPLMEALAGPHGVDRYLELVRPAWSLRDVRAEVVAVRRHTVDSVTLTLRPNDNWQGFRAGQYVRVSVEIDGVRHTRCYSPAGPAHGGTETIELSITVHPEGVVSRHLHAHARPGLALQLSPAQGDFALPAARPHRLLLISGGSGITPVMSMVRTLCAEGHRGPVTFLHYARGAGDVIYADELARLAERHPNLRVVLSHTREPEGAELRGHFHPDHLLAAAPEYAEAQTYACGPTGLLDAVREAWAAEGLEERLHVEQFAPPTLVPADGDEAEGTIHFARSDQSAAVGGGSLLEQAEESGLSPDFGCRMGICHTCTCRKASGAVRNVLTGELSIDEDEDIQLCISVAAGDVVLDL